MSAELFVTSNGVELDGSSIVLDRRIGMPGHEGYSFLVHPAQPGKYSQAGYVLRVYKGGKVVRNEAISASCHSLRLHLHPEEPAFPLGDVYRSLIQRGVDRNIIQRWDEEREASEPFYRGEAQILTDGQFRLQEWNSHRDVCSFAGASWAVVRDADVDDSFLLAVYLWDQAAGRDLTQLYRSVAS